MNTEVRLIGANVTRSRNCIHGVKLGPGNFCPECMAPDLSAIVKRLLGSYFWLPTLQANVRYSRLHDDHDGARWPWLTVIIDEDGDAWLDTGHIDGLRFRMPMTGGGMSQHTRAALVILAEAIRMDNEARPQR